MFGTQRQEKRWRKQL